VVGWDAEEGRLVFDREGQGAIIPVPVRRAARTVAPRSAVVAAPENKPVQGPRKLVPIMSQ
jgi:hypothetical protein